MVPAGEKRRTDYDAMHCADVYCLPGRKVRGEGDLSVNDSEVNEVYDDAGTTYDLYKEGYGRNSIDNRGMELISSVHRSTDLDNALTVGTLGVGEGVTFGEGEAVGVAVEKTVGVGVAVGVRDELTDAVEEATFEGRGVEVAYEEGVAVGVCRTVSTSR